MSTSRALTGGTGDVRPQILSVQGTQATVNQETVLSFGVPVPRAEMSHGKAQVMEILKVDYSINNDEGEPSAQHYAIIGTTAGGATTGTACTLARLNSQLLNPNALSFCWDIINDSVKSGTTVWPFQHRLDDGAGHGVLVAVDRMNLTIGSLTGTAASVVTVKILYRMINVSVMEYIGLVQAQQAQTAA